MIGRGLPTHAKSQGQVRCVATNPDVSDSVGSDAQCGLAHADMNDVTTPPSSDGAEQDVVAGNQVVAVKPVVTAAEVEAELRRIGHDLKPFDIVLVNTRAASCMGTDEYLTAGCGMGREATLYLTTRGVRVCGIDAWGWDVPFVHMRKRWEETHDPSIIWEGHKAGREIPYCHMEKLCNLEQLPPFGFTVACFPHKVKSGSGGWTRAVALFD